ncbi:MAG: murein biosynthesis integral membrane protein MurJ [Rickettsiales bacterium]|nr:murein biosynthesis integral membrane protein MurJ [Rickettsiales bacterium]
MSLIRSTATIGIYTLISRVLGFVRDVTIAHSIGASMLSDAFFVAFKLPNFLRRLFAEGAFNSAFVPMFAGMLASEGESKAKQFASEAMSFLLLILIAVTAIFIISMPWLMGILAPGFSDSPEKFNLTVTLTRITMCYIIFISLVSLLGGILNSKDKFAAVAATPILLNLCLIIVPWCIEDITPNMAYGLAWAVMAAGVVQWLWLTYFCYKLDILPRFVRPRLTPDVKKLLVLIAPVALGAGVVQINLVIDTIIASYFNVGVSYIYYADRINELPLAVIGIALGTAILPMMSRQIREGDHARAHATQNRALELALFVSVPAAMALWVIAYPIISVMFERGAFSHSDATEVSKVLMAFALGLPAFVLVKVIAPGFYARQDTKTPFKIAMWCVLINLVFNLILMQPLQYVGMALATSIASWVNVILMAVILLRRKWLVIARVVWVQLGKIIATSLVMAFILNAQEANLALYLSGNEIERFVALSVVVLCGIVGYLAAAFAFNTMGMRRYFISLWNL